MSVFRVQFAADVNKKISFVETVLSNTFACSLLGLIHWSPSCPLQLIVFQFNSYQIECFFEVQWVCIEHLDLNSNPMDSTHSRIISSER